MPNQGRIFSNEFQSEHVHNHRQMTWVWAQGTALGETQAHSVTSGHE